MIFLDKLAEAKRLVNVEGSVLYVTDKGRIRKHLESGEKQAYRIELKNGKQYVYDSKEKQIKPRKATSGKSDKLKKADVPELQDSTDEVAGRDI